MVTRGSVLNLLYFDTTQDWIHVLVASQINNLVFKLDSKLIETSPKEASFRLVELIQKALQLANLKKPDQIVVPFGPGSFTGIRITVTTARDLAQLWEIPVLGLDSALLYLVGMDEALSSPENVNSEVTGKQKSLICLDGKQGKYYTKYFDGTSYSETKDLKPEEILQALENQEMTPNKWYYTGTFPEFYPKEAIKIEATNLNLSSIMQYSLERSKQTNLKNHHYLNLLPNYIRGTYVDQK